MAVSTVPRITREELKRKIEMKEDFILLDVRNPIDYRSSDVKIPGSKRVPLDDLPERLNELDPSKEAVAYCT